MNYVSVSFAVFYVLVLSANLLTYGKYLKRGIPHLKKCMAMISVGLIIGVLSFLLMFTYDGELLRFMVLLLSVFNALHSVLLIQLILRMTGADSKRDIRLQRGLYTLPLLAFILSVLDYVNPGYVLSVDKYQGSTSYIINYGPRLNILSVVTTIYFAIAVAYVVSLIRRSPFDNKFVHILLLSTALFSSAVQLIEQFFEGVTGYNYHLGMYTLWLPATVICYVYYGYLRTARGNAIGIMRDSYLIFDKRGNLVDINEIGELFFMDYLGESSPKLSQLFKLIGVSEAGQLREYEFDLVREGVKKYYSASSFDISNSISQYCGNGYIIREITGYREKMNELNTMASEDPLTGVKNRRYFYEYAAQVMIRSFEEQLPVTLLMIDLDHFKRVNDNYGHNVGDEVLKGFCDIVQGKLRREDMLFRFGGEEFLVLCEGLSSKVGYVMAERIRTALMETAIATSAGPVKITASIGGCTFVSTGEDEIDRYVELTDQHMYKSKQLGRNRVEYCV